MIMNHPTFYFFDKDFQLVKRIDAQRGIWTGDQWKIEKGIILETSNGGDYEAKRFEDIYLELPESPQTFMRVEKEPEEMNYWQLKRYSERVRSEGYDNTTYLVDMNLKIVFPFITLILMVIGIPVALREGRGGSPTAVALGIVICFLYLTTLAIARSLGLSGMLPPLLSAWMPNGIFLLFGVYLMMHMNR
jgi:lipopolysaccharide export system permease protein